MQTTSPDGSAAPPPVRAHRPVPPATGPLAVARLAAGAAAAACWLRIVTTPGGDDPATVAAALGALGTLRTELRSLRPLLDRAHAVRCRAATDAPARALAARHELDVRIALLDGVAADPEAAVLRAALVRTRRRTPLTGPGPGLAAELAGLAAGRIGLRDAAPLGDPGLPVDVLLPPLLHRRFRKLVRDTAPGDAAAVHRRAAELRIVLALAADAGTAAGTDDASGPVAAAAAALQDRAAAALQADAAAGLADALVPGPARDALRAVHRPDLREPLSALAGLRELLPVDTAGPARRAAGGVVLRPGPGGPAVLLVHRPRHGDWSLPKGAVEPGESDVDAAVREVREETGLRCRVGAEVTGVRYRDRNRRAKQVRFWIMTPRAGGHGRPDPGEVDRTAWVPLAQARRWLTRERDRAVLDRAHGDTGTPTGTPTAAGSGRVA